MFSRISVGLARSLLPVSLAREGQKPFQRLQLRTLLSSSNLSEVKLEVFSEVLAETQSHCSAANSESDRSRLLEILPKSQDVLPARKMSDSLLHAVIPMGSNPEVQLKYISSVGGARLGRLLQDMDYFAAVVVYKHILNPLQTDKNGLSAHSVVTARMDHVHLKQSIKEDLDVVLVGHVTWVGNSSAEVGVRLEQLERDGSRRHVLEAGVNVLSTHFKNKNLFLLSDDKVMRAVH